MPVDFFALFGVSICYLLQYTQQKKYKFWHGIIACLKKIIMENTSETIDVLNDLVMINNDRIAGYEKALEELSPEDADLKPLFENMIDESRQARISLGREVQVLGGTMAEGTMASGKIYRAWMDLKAVFTGHDRHAVLSNCEAGEDAAQKAYTHAMEEDNVPAFLKELISDQQQMFKYAHDDIRALRNQAVS